MSHYRLIQLLVKLCSWLSTGKICWTTASPKGATSVFCFFLELCIPWSPQKWIQLMWESLLHGEATVLNIWIQSSSHRLEFQPMHFVVIYKLCDYTTYPATVRKIRIVKCLFSQDYRWYCMSHSGYIAWSLGGSWDGNDVTVYSFPKFII